MSRGDAERVHELEAALRRCDEDLKRTTAELDAARATIERLVGKDPLTDLRGSDYFEERLRAEFARARRYQRPLSILIIAVDDVEALARDHGTDGEKAMMLAVTDALGSVLRDTDEAARTGPYQISVVLLESDSTGALAFSERVLERISATPVVYPGGSFPITVCAGVASLPDPAHEDAPGFTAAATAALHRAAKDGTSLIAFAE